MSKVNTIEASAQIIELYKQGYSSKDICRICNVSVLLVRKCLQSAGFDTKSYRKASESVKEKVLLLIKAGYSYNKIENLLCVSTHLIREIVMSNGFLGFASNYHHPIQLSVEETEVSLAKIETLKLLYLKGVYGLVKCAVKCDVSDEEFLWFVFHLTGEEKEIHLINLKSQIKKLYFVQYIPVAAIAKKLDISPSLVKKYIKSAE